MSLVMRWVGEGDLERVAETRARCYAAALEDLPKYLDRIDSAGRAKAGDFLLAERDGRAVGTATSLALTMWVRGSPISCQGVAYVGAIKTERRKRVGSRPLAVGSEPPDSPGVATAVMRETLRLGREREHVLSALLPFRASFYEHFGYGLVERRCDWTVPLALLPHGDFSGIRFMETEDRPAVYACRQRMVEAGQCDIERPAACWENYLKQAEKGWTVVDRPADGGPANGWMYFVQERQAGRDMLRVEDMVYDSPAAFRRLLHFLGSLRDQFWGVVLTLPADLPLNRLLRETQIPHRLVNHPTAEVRAYTRTQVRVLQHERFLESLHVPEHYRGSAVVAVHECEGHVSRFRLEVAGGSLSAKRTEASAEVECTDSVWASIACGDLDAAIAAQQGFLQTRRPAAVAVLRCLADGPVPFCTDGF
jgi:predicted acetyltransferase